MSIHVALRHVTQYTYDRPVTIGPQVVRLRVASLTHLTATGARCWACPLRQRTGVARCGRNRDRRAGAEKAELVKLRYFAGLSIGEAAAALEISERTAKRH